MRKLLLFGLLIVVAGCASSSFQDCVTTCRYVYAEEFVGPCTRTNMFQEEYWDSACPNREALDKFCFNACVDGDIDESVFEDDIVVEVLESAEDDDTLPWYRQEGCEYDGCNWCCDDGYSKTCTAMSCIIEGGSI